MPRRLLGHRSVKGLADLKHFKDVKEVKELIEATRPGKIGKLGGGFKDGKPLTRDEMRKVAA